MFWLIIIRFVFFFVEALICYLGIRFALVSIKNIMQAKSAVANIKNPDGHLFKGTEYINKHNLSKRDKAVLTLFLSTVAILLSLFLVAFDELLFTFIRLG